MAKGEVLNGGGKVNVCVAVAQIAIKLSWLANAMKANDDSPAAESLDGITAQLDALVEPVCQMQQGVQS